MWKEGRTSGDELDKGRDNLLGRPTILVGLDRDQQDGLGSYDRSRQDEGCSHRVRPGKFFPFFQDAERYDVGSEQCRKCHSGLHCLKMNGLIDERDSVRRIAFLGCGLEKGRGWD